MTTEQIGPRSSQMTSARAPARGGATAVVPPGAAVRTPRWLRALGLLAWFCAVLWAWQAGGLRAYGDVLARELIARRVTDSLTPGLAQLGTVWLPLPSLVLAPLVALDPLWRLGIAGALVGGIYLQVAIGALYRAGTLIGGATAGWLAAVVFLANPNTLYSFTVPLTEAPALAFACLCGAGLAEALAGFRRGEVRQGAILTAALAAAAMSLCRYDGWLLAVAGGAILCLGALVWLRDWSKTEAVALFYAVVPVAAIGIWLLYNALIFGDPLTFQRGPNAAATQLRDMAARGLIPAVDGRPPDAGRPLRAAATYGRAVLENMGPGPVALALAGAALALLRARSRPAGLALVALAAPLVFYVTSLSGGQAVIVTRAADPEGLWNVRYGGALAPFIALAIAALVGDLRARSWRVAVPLALALAALVSGGLLFAAPLGPVTIAEGRLQQRAVSAVGGREAARWLGAQPDAGLILLDEGLEPQTHELMVHGERPLRRYVTSTSPASWDAALQQPSPDIALIVTLASASQGFHLDRVAKALLADGGIAGYTRAYDNGEIIIFRRGDGPAVAPSPAVAAPGTPLSPRTTLTNALAGPVGIVLTVALIALLLLREALPAASGAGLRRWRSRLTVALVVLSVPFGAIVATRLLAVAAPVFAWESSPVATVGAAAIVTLATPTVAPPTATVAPAPGAAPAPAATPSTTPPGATATVPGTPPGPPPPGVTRTVPSSPQQIAAALARLRAGEFEARIAYSNGTHSTALVRFEFGDGPQADRLYTRTTYQGATGTRTVERIVIGDRAWTRQVGLAWVAGPATQPVREEVQPLLPAIGALLPSAQTDGANALRWYDETRDADTRLETDPVTGIPRRLQQTTRGTATTLTVAYLGWNTPVEIAPPATPGTPGG